MLKLNASYSKKVPAEGEYSSQSYHASVEVELPDGLTPEQLQGRIHETFDLVKNSVEVELHEKCPTNGRDFQSENTAKRGVVSNRTDLPATGRRCSASSGSTKVRASNGAAASASATATTGHSQSV